ncbi:MAG: hypothetical protein KAS32_20250 [Candidatus Peribacteraceae bacterium]|nr:hypothetical protein [Candidatus Peribacteraceae bacterium]
MKIKPFYHHHKQMSRLGRYHWSIARLIELTKDFPVMGIHLDHLNIYHRYKDLSIRDMVMHFKAVKNADLSCPIILDEEGDIMDGRHRIIRALIAGVKTIKAVRFEENPSPCQVDAE